MRFSHAALARMARARSTILAVVVLLALAGVGRARGQTEPIDDERPADAYALAPGAEPADDPALWPEEQRAFLQNGPGLLLSSEEHARLLAMGAADRSAFITDFLARDPVPETPQNELAEGIRRRRLLVGEEPLSLQDLRGRLLFLNGPPAERLPIDCGVTFRTLEIWSYPEGTLEQPQERQLVVYRPEATLPWRLWLPIDSKRVLYTDEMEYWLQQFEELRGRIIAKRFDLQTCKDTPKVDDATGVSGLFGFRDERPTNDQLKRYLEPPGDLAAWARAAAATPLPGEPAELALEQVNVYFPQRIGQRIVTRLMVVLPAGADLQPFVEEGVTDSKPELRLAVDGWVEQEDEIFEQFRMLFKLAPPAEAVPIALAVDRALRPGRAFVMRLRIRDDVSGAVHHLARGFLVPEEATPQAEAPVPEGAIVALGEELAGRRIAGADSLVMVPPETDVVLGLWRAEALVTGTRIVKVVFLVDGQVQLTRTQPPFSVELRLAQYPTEQTVRAEGYDESGELVAADEVVLNQPTGALRVRILEPRRGSDVGETVLVKAEVVVPEDQRVERVEVLINDELLETLTSPPWQAEVEVPPGEEIAYATVVAVLEDGTRAEDVRFLRAPEYLEEVNVELIELYTTVTDRSGRPVKDLPQELFQVLEDGRAQTISKFEQVEDLPLTIGITIDTSGSMATSLPEAQEAGGAFLANIITPKDRFFIVSFAHRPELLLAPTDDVTAAEGLLERLRSEGNTALHDAVVTTLYYFRGVRGRRAMVLLSDGDDTASSIPFRDALEYARRSGVAIYTVGLNVSKLSVSVRNKLGTLAQETGGRAFFIGKAEELAGVYDEIEDELRSQYLLAYSPDMPASGGEFRTVEVKMNDGKYKARTIRGYYP